MKKLTFILFTLLANYSFAQKSRVVSSLNLKEKTIPTVTMSENIVASFNPKGDEIWFFEHENFKGKKLVLKPGTYTLQQIGNDWNDRISSILIPEGYEIQIFENDNFSGYNANLDGYWQEGTNMQRWSNKDFAQLKTIEGEDYHINYNDKISSIQIYNQR